MNVSKLARQLNVTTTELLDKLPELGFSVGRRAIKVDDSQVDKIIMAWKRQAKLQAIKDRHQQVTEVREKVVSGPAVKKITLGKEIIVKDLADLLKLPLSRVMAEMMKNGIMASLNERLDQETATIIAEDLGFQVEAASAAEDETADQSQRQRLEQLLSDRLQTSQRPPVVVIMGHVDHGKTKLLDAIRKTNIMEGEAGGITQHIGAYQTVLKKGKKERTITFLDTPGHEAFKAMRSRGGQVADVAVLVVAADDGLQPQTLESLSIIQKENLPFVVAINKIDKEGADPEKVKKELTEINLTPEDWGGKTICVPISAKQGLGIEELLDMVLLVADLAELKADSSGQAVGTIIESHMDKNEGPLATVLIQAGTLHVNDLVTVGPITGKIKAMKTWKGEEVSAAPPGMPVRILGLKGVAQVGDILQVTTDKKSIRQLLKQQPVMRTSRAAVLEGVTESSAEVPTLNLVLRADVLGSLEAIEESLTKLNTAKAQTKVIKKGLGFVNESDIQMAESSQALIIVFNLKIPRPIEALASEKRITLMEFDIIYKLLEEVERRLKGLIQPETVRTLVGKLKVLAIFKKGHKDMIIGGRVTDGKAVKPCLVKVLRKEQIITFGQLTDLRSNKEKLTEAVSGNEIGLKFEGEPVVEVGDTLEFFKEENVT